MFRIRDTFDYDFRARIARCGVDADGRYSKPSLDDIALDMDVLDASIGGNGLVAKNQANTAANTRFVELVSQCVVANHDRGQRDEDTGPCEEATQHAVGEQLRCGTLDRSWIERYWLG